MNTEIENELKGCSIYSFTDSQGSLCLVLFDEDGRVKEGGEEARAMLTKANMEKRYTLSLVREIK